jgi:hypothetical protein
MSDFRRVLATLQNVCFTAHWSGKSICGALKVFTGERDKTVTRSRRRIINLDTVLIVDSESALPFYF